MRLPLDPDRCDQTWRVPECPFPIEWSAAVLDQIRAAVVDAFFSLPHGGVEIGGVLCGTRSDGQVRILAARPLECEHALGPTFTLSDNDHARFRALLEEGCRDLRAQGMEPLGWYHSHTRSEIFMSPQDVEIHNRYFPDPWHVALVVRPHLMQPVRAGFFFREADGSIHAEASYREFVLEPVPEEAPAVPSPTPGGARPAGETACPTVPAADTAQPEPPKRSWQWLWWVATVLVLIPSAVLFKSDWMGPSPHDPPPSVSLMAYDLDGQLQIRWDRAAEPIRSAEGGTLEITDGATKTVVKLEKQRLRSGTVSYTRAGARVDLRLALDQPGGQRFEEFTTFLGGQPAAPDATRLRQLERDVAGLRWMIKQEKEHRH